MGEPRIMVAVDPDALDAIMAKLDALDQHIRAAQIASAPEWVDAGAYARRRGVSRRTVMNWIAKGEVESRRTGSKTEVRISQGA